MIRGKNKSASQEAKKMARFSLGREEEDEGGTSSSPITRSSFPKRRRITFAGTFSCCTANLREQQEQQLREQENDEEIVEEEEEEDDFDPYEEEEFIEDEEEEEEEELVSELDRDLEVLRGNGSRSGVQLDPDRDLEGLRGNGSVSVVLSDPDVLDCPICLERLSIPVFQCENGHIACSSCCIKIANKCPSCCWPIGYNRCRAIEKVLESVKVACTNKRYGCTEILSYSKKAVHESACTCAPLSCPYRGCDFVDTSKEVYAHFSDRHGSSAKRIFFGAIHPIYVEKHQTYQILQESTEGIIFIINHSSDRLGSAVNIICIGPTAQKRRFPYELVATDGDTTYKLESTAESILKWSENLHMKKFLLVPKDVVNSSAHLKLEVFIEEREYIRRGQHFLEQ